ncbi:hypothetical protein ACNFJ7_02270 [Sphingomonas sp. HT-1]|uniref:hypothetical protein n=1 Tax=unclassified Sphingomonas TaxID=196159 RepID=UPI0002DEC8E3|nr:MULTISPECIES: hypothetical protein [unclassified Sphingomonas]KTF70687.1 hypothetical protein ATB93_18715 [Sphingomonas sp. WG]
MTPSRFPPSFNDNPLSYGFALFSLALITSIALAYVIAVLLERTREREINAAIRNPALPPPEHGITLLSLHRMIYCGLLSTIILGAGPDVLLLLAWGEASDNAMWWIFQLDRVCDAATIGPFLMSMFLAIRAEKSIEHRLGLDPAVIPVRPTWGMVRDKLKITGAVLCIAVGVTLYKAAGLR